MLFLVIKNLKFLVFNCQNYKYKQTVNLERNNILEKDRSLWSTIIKEIVEKSKKAFKIKSNIKTHGYNSMVIGFRLIQILQLVD